jgi:hypothetical protein
LLERTKERCFEELGKDVIRAKKRCFEELSEKTFFAHQKKRAVFKLEKWLVKDTDIQGLACFSCSTP